MFEKRRRGRTGRGSNRQIGRALCALTLGVLAIATGLPAETFILGDAAVGVPTGGLSLPANGQVGATLNLAGALLHAPEAQTKYPAITGSGYTVAILDTGVDGTHPALSGRVVAGHDFVNGDADPDDDYGHGTHVAGIVASGDTTYRGLAPEAGIAAVKFLDSSGSG